jgi:UDP-GlcNAc:undecaprenyl-phosphate GlcNAc-1-phosphate transferase
MIFLLVGIAVSVLLTSVLIRLAGRFGWVVRPRSDRWSQRTVAKFGGIPILLTGLGGIFFVAPDRKLGIVMALTGAMSLLGFLDDVFQLRPLGKLGVQVIICVCAVYFGVIYPLTPSPHLNLLFTVFWLVCITNAFNIIDNMDGLSCGVAVIALVRIILLTGFSSGLSQLMFVMVGALIGFLLFNFNPARIFMGDTGSLGVGFFVACCSVLMTDHLSGLFSVLAVPSLILLLPVFDVVLVSVTRGISGRAVSAGAKDHTSHRLVLLGMSERTAVLLLYLFAASSGAVTYLWKADWPNLGAGIVALYMSMTTLFWLYLARIQLPEEWLSQRNATELVLPGFLEHITQRAAVVVFDALMLTLSLYFAFLFRLDGLTKQLTGLLLFACGLSIAIRIPLLSICSGGGGHWRIRSRRDIYPVLVTGVLGGVVLSGISYYLPQSKQIMPAILGLDMVFSTGLLILGRLAPSMFDDLVSKLRRDSQNARDRELLSRENTEEQASGIEGVIALGSENGVRSAFLFGVPIHHLSEAARLISGGSISSLYLLPQCTGRERQRIIQLCRARGIHIHSLDYFVEPVSYDESNDPYVPKPVGPRRYSD